MSEAPVSRFANMCRLGDGCLRGALRIAEPQLPLRGKGLGKPTWRLHAETRVKAFRITRMVQR
jgi:hypothetical protein